MFSKIYGKPIIREFTLYPDFKKSSSHWSQKYILKFNLNNSNTVVCVSKALELWCKENNIKTDSVIIGNDACFKPSELSKYELRKKMLNILQSSQYPVILFLGPKSYRKGFDITYKTFELILEEYPKALMILLGISQEKPIINGTIYDVSKLVSQNKIIDLGLVENPEPYFQMADLTIFPSRREGLPNVVIESMATGTPVIARKIKDITDTIIENGIDGFLIEEGDNPEKYFEKIKKLISDNIAYKTISVNSQIKIRRYYSPEIIMNQYLKLYEQHLTE